MKNFIKMFVTLVFFSCHSVPETATQSVSKNMNSEKESTSVADEIDSDFLSEIEGISKDKTGESIQCVRDKSGIDYFTGKIIEYFTGAVHIDYDNYFENYDAITFEVIEPELFRGEKFVLFVDSNKKTSRNFEQVGIVLEATLVSPPSKCKLETIINTSEDHDVVGYGLNILKNIKWME